ncbi:MAG TPA: hypothetical protein VHV82_14150 [Sporichthyaceae bacterium]|jgi:hypothetical protein|nr:hypothetical protein [Sporichthyaceae bacterium]
MRITKTKVAVAAASAAIVALGSTTAYAYFTTTGSGTGSAAVGSSTPLTATVTVAGPALLPDGVAHGLGGSVTNSSSAAQHVSSAVLAISTITASGGGALNNSLCDFQLVQPTLPAGGETIPPGTTTVAAPAAGAGSISMVDNGLDQSACEGASVNLVLTLS